MGLPSQLGDNFYRKEFSLFEKFFLLRVDSLLDGCYFQGMQTICNKFHSVKMAEKYRDVHIYLKKYSICT